MRIGTAIARASALAASAVLLWPQAATLAHRDAYRAWREADPALEKEAAQISQLETRGPLVWQAAAKYGEARSGYFRSLAGDTDQISHWIEDPGAALDRDVTPPSEVQAFVRAAVAKVGGDITVYAGDNDRGIQQLRQALERERAALTSLNAMIGNRQAMAEKSTKSAQALQAAIAKARELYQELGQTFTGAAAQSDLETAAWGKYYDTLSAAAKPEAPPPPPVENIRPAESNPPAVPAGPAATAAPVAPTPPAAPVETTRPPATPPVPLTRYVGEWFYPSSGGLFHGFQPEGSDLAVRERNGMLTGTLTVRFLTPADFTGDPSLQFTFSGEVKPVRTQVLALETSEGAKGFIELIPGGAFNLLEVNFQTEPRPDKIRLGNFVMLKK